MIYEICDGPEEAKKWRIKLPKTERVNHISVSPYPPGREEDIHVSLKRSKRPSLDMLGLT
jgi:hypothetical protein